MTRLFLPALVAVAVMAAGATAAAQDGPASGRGMQGPQTLEAMQARQDMMFDRLDANHDGFITGDELAALTSGPMAAQGGGRMRAMLSRADANNDARLSKDELRAAAATRFQQMDVNGDGVISDSERPRTPAPAAPMPMPTPAPDSGMPPMGDPAPGG